MLIKIGKFLFFIFYILLVLQAGTSDFLNGVH